MERVIRTSKGLEDALHESSMVPIIMDRMGPECSEHSEDAREIIPSSVRHARNAPLKKSKLKTGRVVFGPPIPGQPDNIYIVQNSNRYEFYHSSKLTKKRMFHILNQFELKESHLFVTKESDLLFQCMGENKDLYTGLILEALRSRFGTSVFFDEVCKIVLRTMSVTCYQSYSLMDKKKKIPELKRAYETVLTRTNNRLYFDVNKAKTFVLNTFSEVPTLLETAKSFKECKFLKPHVLRSVVYSHVLCDTRQEEERDCETVDYEGEKSITLVYKDYAYRVHKTNKKIEKMDYENVEFVTMVGPYMYGITTEDTIVSNNVVFEPVEKCEFFSTYGNEFAYVKHDKLSIVRYVRKTSGKMELAKYVFDVRDDFNTFEYTGSSGNHMFYTADETETKHVKATCMCDEEDTVCAKCKFSAPKPYTSSAYVKDNVLVYTDRGIHKTVCMDVADTLCKGCSCASRERYCTKCIKEMEQTPNTLYISPSVASMVETIQIGDTVYYGDDIVRSGIVQHTKFVNCAKYIVVADPETGKESTVFPELVSKPCQQSHLTVVVHGVVVMSVENMGYDRKTKTYRVAAVADDIRVMFDVDEKHVLQVNPIAFFQHCRRPDDCIFEVQTSMKLTCFRLMKRLHSAQKHVEAASVRLFDEHERVSAISSTSWVQLAYGYDLDVEADTLKRRQKHCHDLKRAVMEAFRRYKEESDLASKKKENRPPVIKEEKQKRHRVEVARALLNNGKARRKRRRRR